MASVIAVQSTWLASASDDPTGSKCVGERVPLILSAIHYPFLNIRVGERTGWFLLDSGTNLSLVDFRAYDFPVTDGARRISGSSLPTLKSAFFRSRDLSYFKGPGDEPVLGIIGADFLGSRTVEIHLDDEHPFISVSDERCSASTFEERGLRAIEQRGYFTSHWFWKWWRLWRGGNNPVAFVRIGHTVAPAMINSGYAGEIDRALEINEAFVEHLRKEGVAMRSAGTTSFTDCTGQEAQLRCGLLATLLSPSPRKTGRRSVRLVRQSLRLSRQIAPNAVKASEIEVPLGADRNDAPLAAWSCGDRWTKRQGLEPAGASRSLPVPPFAAVSLAWTARGSGRLATVWRRTTRWMLTL